MSEGSVPFLSFEAVAERLRTRLDVTIALARSGLLGDCSESGVPIVGVEHFEQYGTQWRPEIGKRSWGTDPYQDIPEIDGDEQPNSAHLNLQFSQGTSPETADSDPCWIAQFYLRPNLYFFPSPAELALIGPLPLKLSAPAQVSWAELPTHLFPDPEGSLALVMVLARQKIEGEPFRIAYDVAMPVLDALAFQYDQPLPVAHSMVVGIPSGTISINLQKVPKLQTIDSCAPPLTTPLYPELKDAVALYREGISSNNPFHQFLTLWKVYENVCRVRGDWRNRHKKKDVKTTLESFPSPTVFAFRNFEGLTFDQARQRLRDPYRNALAHGGVDARTGASAEDYYTVSCLVPIVRYMARVVLENMRATLASNIS